MNDALSELDERAVALVNEYRDGSQFAILIRTKDGDNNAVNTICPNVDLDAIARFLHQVADNPSVKSTVDAALVKARLNWAGRISATQTNGGPDVTNPGRENRRIFMTVQHSDRGPSADERNADALMLVCEQLHDVMLDNNLPSDLILDQRQRTITIRYE